MRKITLFICLLVFSVIGLNAQTVTIGAGTSTQRYPLGNYYGFERSASIYTAAEATNTGNIATLAWYANTAGTARPIVVYLKETASATLTADTWANQIAGATQVYAGTITPSVGWNTITLTVPFNYSGGANNLMVLVEANYGGSGGTGSGGNAVRYSTATGMHEYWQQDSTVPTGNGTVSANRPNIQVTFGAIVTCFTPSSLSANSITQTGANLTWTAGGSETLWNIEWGPTGFTQGTGTLVNGVSNPYVLGGLTANTTYQYYVKADCGAVNGTSNWAGPYSFTTMCNATSVPYVQDFESVTVPALPSCTSVVNSGTGNLWATASNPGSGFTTKVLKYGYNLSNAANTWFFTQGISLTAGISYRISYNYGNNSTGYTEKMKVAYGTLASAAAMTNTLADHTTINQNAQQYNQVDFTPSADGVYYFGFQAYSATNQYNLYLDNINIIVTPTCSAPVGLAATGVTNAAATINWTATTGNYEYVLDTVATDPAGSGTTLAGETYNASSLSASTTYYFHVRTVCAGPSYSTWSTVSFTTLPNPPANDGCSTAIALTPGVVFADQAVSGTLYGATTTAGVTPSCQSNFGFDVWYSVVVPASGSVTVETQVAATNSMSDSVVAAFSGACGALTQIGCDDDGGPTGANNFMSVLSLTGLNPGDLIYIGVWKYDNSSAPASTTGNFLISAYDASLSAATFDASSFKVYPNPVKDVLNLSYSSEITSVEVYNMLGQKVLAKSLGMTQGQVDVSALNTGNYIVKVTADGMTKAIKIIKQ